MVRGERGVDFAADDVPDNWNFNGSNPCLHHGGNYNQNQNHGPFYVNYNSASNTNSNIGCRLLEADAGHWACRVWLNLLSVVRVPHPFYYAELTAQHLLTMSRQDTAWYTSGRVSPRNHPRRWNGCEATRRILSLMKRVRVCQQILSEDNLRLAIREVNRGHRRNGDHSLNKKVLEIEANMDEYVAELRRFIEDLVSGDAHMHPPLKRRRWDRNADSGKGKWRDINEPLLWPDQYVHHAVLQPMIPHIMRSMDKYCIASVPGRGNSYGVKAIKKWMKGDAAGTRYGAECDIYHCFEELDPPYVIQALKRLFKDRELHHLRLQQAEIAEADPGYSGVAGRRGTKAERQLAGLSDRLYPKGGEGQRASARGQTAPKTAEDSVGAGLPVRARLHHPPKAQPVSAQANTAFILLPKGSKPGHLV